MSASSEKQQPKNPLHGVKLADIIEALVDTLGWEEMALRVNVNCFKSDPSVKSSLKFLRKTPWAREKVEAMYLKTCVGSIWSQD
ncbi:MAG: VF530 family DNA-binding protein [Thalassotalea sp.]